MLKKLRDLKVLSNLDPKKEFEKTICRISYCHQIWQVFSDFCEMSAIAIHNRISMDAEYEKRYLALVKRYSKEEIDGFCELLALTVGALEKDRADFLGQMFMSLKLGNHWVGQFFTPNHICRVVAEMMIDEKLSAKMRKGFITLQEPACGAGAMVLAFIEALDKKSEKYRGRCHVTAIDVDATAFHMAYIQLSLCGVPAIVVLGNTLSMEIRAAWPTPAHILGGWDFKLREKAA